MEGVETMSCQHMDVSRGDAYNLRPIWDVLLDIYIEIQKICVRHHLRYYACGGTALGAVRHRGFIPWDDDFDLFMPREDYMKFVNQAQTELPEYLSWSSCHNNPNHTLPFGKVILNDFSKMPSFDKNADIKIRGDVFVDILPLDGLPSGWFSNYLWLFKRWMWRHLVSPQTQEARLRYERWISKRSFDQSCRVEDCKEVGVRLRRYRGWPREIFDGAKMFPFDRVWIPVPVPVDVFLRNMFGSNYMQLPPLEQRFPSHCINL